MQLRTSLHIEDLRLCARVGCQPEERARPQTVSLRLAVHFEPAPLACRSDRLHDTVCYAVLAHAARERCSETEHRTIESLGWDLHQSLSRLLPDWARLDLRLTKLEPPVASLRGGACFQIETAPEELPCT